MTGRFGNIQHLEMLSSIPPGKTPKYESRLGANGRLCRINPPGFPKWFESFIDADTVDPSSPRYRSVWLGVLTYRLRMPKTFENEIPSLLYYCSEYLRLHHFQRYCFKDLRQFVERLDPNSMQEFQELSHQIAYQSRPVHAQTDTAKDWTISELNALKFDYLLSISVFEKPVRTKVVQNIPWIILFPFSQHGRKVGDILRTLPQAFGERLHCGCRAD